MKNFFASLLLGLSLLTVTSAALAQTPAPAAPAAAEAAAPAAAAPAAEAAAPAAAPVPNKGDTAWMTVATDLVERAIEAIEGAARTGKIGDGKIFVYDLEQVVRIRTGETGAEAL